MEQRIIQPENTTFSIGSDQKLYMKTDRGKEGPVQVNWAFPLTDPADFVIVSNENREFVGLLKNYQRLEPKSLAILKEQLEESYFLPRITKIEKIDDRFRMMTWTVQTDKGPRTFEVRSRQRDIRWLNDHHVIITDIAGNRYEILDMNQLDADSRDLLEMEV